MKKYFWFLMLILGIAMIADPGHASRVAIGTVKASSLDAVQRRIENHFSQYEWSTMERQGTDGSTRIIMSTENKGGLAIMPERAGYFEIRVVNFDSAFSSDENDRVLKEVLSLFEESSTDYTSHTYHSLNPGMKSCFIASLR